MALSWLSMLAWLASPAGAEVCLASPAQRGEASIAAATLRAYPTSYAEDVSRFVQEAFGPAVAAAVARAGIEYRVLPPEHYFQEARRVLGETDNGFHFGFFDPATDAVFMDKARFKRHGVLHETAHAVDSLLRRASAGGTCENINYSRRLGFIDNHVECLEYSFLKGAAVHELFRGMLRAYSEWDRRAARWEEQSAKLDARCGPLFERAEAGDSTVDQAELDRCSSASDELDRAKPPAYSGEAPAGEDRFVDGYARKNLAEFFAVGLAFYGLGGASRSALERRNPSMHAIMKDFLISGCMP